MNLEIINCEQGTEEWLKARCGVITASCIKDVMANPMRGETVSKTRSKYMRQLAAERISQQPCVTFFGNADTERGKENEPKARELYEIQTGQTVTQVGFMKRDGFGCSPDGLVGEDGGVEIKSKRGDIHIEVLLNGGIPPEHMKQIQFSLMVTGRQWWDFVSYCPGLPLYVERVFPDMEMQMEMKAACHFFLTELDQLVATVRNL